MRKRRGRLARLVTVFLTLLVALGLTGMGYGIWSDTLNIDATVETGAVLFNLTATDNYTSPSGGSVTCEVVSDALEVTVISANVTYHYYGDFTLENIGDIPLKMVVDVSTVPPKVVAQIENVVGDGTVDPGETEDGKVHVYLEDSTQEGQTFIVTSNVVLWNQ